MKSLYRNRGMQRLLIWELDENNPITRRTARLREINAAPIIDVLKNSSVDIRAITALVIGGIYYLILHRESSTFCGIDFTTHNGKKMFEDAIRFLSDAIIDKLNPSSEAQTIAQKLKAKGIDSKTIEECTGVKLDAMK